MNNTVISSEENLNQEDLGTTVDALLNATDVQQKAPVDPNSTLPIDKMSIEQTPAEQAATEQASEEELKNSTMLRHQQGRMIRENATRYANAINSLDTLKSSENTKKEQDVYESSFPIRARYGDSKDLDPNDPLFNYKRVMNAIDEENNLVLNRITSNGGYTTQQKLKDQILKVNAKEANVKDVLEIKVRQHEKGERLVTGYVEDGDTANVVIDGVDTRFRIINGAISFDATDDWGTHNKEYQIERIAERIGKSPADVTEQDVKNFKTWTNFVIVNAIKNNGFSKYEPYNPNKVDYYNQYIKENNHDLSYILRPMVDNKSNELDVYGRPFAQILSADGKVNISDSLAMNSMFNLNKYRDSEETYFNLQPALRAIITNDYEGMKASEGYLKAKAFRDYMSSSPTPEYLGFDDPRRWQNIALGIINSIPEGLYQSWNGLKRIYYDVTGDENALEKQIAWYADHQNLNLFGKPNESYQLYRQLMNQEVVDTINKGGAHNIIKGFLMGMIMSPIDALVDSLPEMIPLAMNGYLGVGIKAVTGSRAAGIASSLFATALTAGVQETNAIENEYYVRNGHAMPAGLWYTTLAGATLALSIEIPAAMTFLGNPLAMLNPKRFMTAKADTTFVGLLKKNSWEVFKSFINETVTEPVQNAYFNTMAKMNTTADLPNFWSYYKSQWQGTKFGERVAEAAVAAGMSGMMGGRALLGGVALPLAMRGIQQNFGDPTDRQLGKTNPAGSTVEDIQLLKNDENLRNIAVDLQNQRDEINKLLDPNVATDAQAFNDALETLKQKVQVASSNSVTFSQDGTWSSPQLELLGRLIKQSNAFMIAKALQYAKTRSLDINQTIQDLYTKENVNATGNESIDEMREWLEHEASLNVFGSIPKTVIEDRLINIRKALEQDPNDKHLQDMEKWLLEYYNEEELELKFDDGRSKIVHKSAFEQFAETYGSFHPNASKQEVLQELQKHWDIASMNDDVMENGMYHNSLKEYTQRIRKNVADIKHLEAGIQGQITNINNLLPDDVDKLKEDSTDIQTLVQNGDEKAIEAFKAKYAPYTNDKWNVNVLIDAVKKQNILEEQLQADFIHYNRFLKIRLEKTGGIIGTIKNAISNNIRDKASFEYETSTGTGSITIYMGQFYKGNLLNPAANHNSLKLIKYIFEESLQVAKRYQEIADDLKNDLPTMVAQFAQQDANEAVAKVQNDWNELVDLQQNLQNQNNLTTKEKETAKDYETYYEEVKTKLYPILLSAINKTFKDEVTKEIYIAMLEDNDSDWVSKAQQFTEEQINSDYSATNGFDFKSLYSSLDSNLRASVKGILKAFYAKANNIKRTKDDLHTITDAGKEALLKVAPYKDNKTNLLYNLGLQIKAIEKIEKQQGKEKKQPKKGNKQALTQEELNLWMNIEKWIKKLQSEYKLDAVTNWRSGNNRVTVWFKDKRSLVFDYNNGVVTLYGKKGENPLRASQEVDILERSNSKFVSIQRLAMIFNRCFDADAINNNTPNSKIDSVDQSIEQEAEVVEESDEEVEEGEDNPFASTENETQGVITGESTGVDVTEEDVQAVATDPSVIYHRMAQLLMENKAYINRTILLANKDKILEKIKSTDYSKKDNKTLYGIAMNLTSRLAGGMEAKGINLDAGIYNSSHQLKAIKDTNFTKLLQAIDERIQKYPNAAKTPTFKEIAYYLRRMTNVYPSSPDTVLRAGYANGILLSMIIKLEKNYNYRKDPLFKKIKNNFKVGGTLQNNSNARIASYVTSGTLRIYVGKDDYIELNYKPAPEDKNKFSYNEDRKCYYLGNKPLYFRNITEETPFAVGTNFTHFHLIAPTSYTYQDETYSFDTGYYIADAEIISAEPISAETEAVTQEEVIQDAKEAEEQKEQAKEETKQEQVEVSETQEVSTPQENTEPQPVNQEVSEQEVPEDENYSEINPPVFDVEDTNYEDDSFFNNMEEIPENTVDVSANVKESNQEEEDPNIWNPWGLDMNNLQFNVISEFDEGLDSDKDIQRKTLNYDDEIITLAHFLQKVAFTCISFSPNTFKSFPDNAFMATAEDSKDSAKNDIREYLAVIQEAAKTNTNAKEIIKMFQKGLFSVLDDKTLIQMIVPPLTATLYNVNDTVKGKDFSQDYTIMDIDTGNEAFLRGNFTVVAINALPYDGLKGMLQVAHIDDSDGTTVVPNPKPIIDPAMPSVKEPEKEKDAVEDANDVINTNPPVFEENTDETTEAEDEENPLGISPLFMLTHVILPGMKATTAGEEPTLAISTDNELGFILGFPGSGHRIFIYDPSDFTTHVYRLNNKGEQEEIIGKRQRMDGMTLDDFKALKKKLLDTYGLPKDTKSFEVTKATKQEAPVENNIEAPTTTTESVETQDSLLDVEKTTQENTKEENEVSTTTAKNAEPKGFTTEGLTDLRPFTEEEQNTWKTGCYAGIGSREVGKAKSNWTKWMKEQAETLEKNGLILRSGAASGSDTAFESGVKDSAHKEIFTASDITQNTYNNAETAKNLAVEVHPIHDKLRGKNQQFAMNLHARNGYQILGADLHTPVDFVLCWTAPEGVSFGGRTTHGTGQAIRLANRMNIPVFNMWFKEDQQRFKKWYPKYLATKGDKQAVSNSAGKDIVEVSSIGKEGKPFSALNLKLEVNGKETTVERAYQASKVTDNPKDHEDWDEQLTSKNSYIKNKGKAFHGNELDVVLPYAPCIPQAYFILYLCGLKAYIEGYGDKNADVNKRTQTLKKLLSGKNKFKDSYDGNSLASQADILAFLSYLASQLDNGVATVLDYVSAVDYHDKDSYKDILQEFNNWFMTTEKYRLANQEEVRKAKFQELLNQGNAFMKNPPEDDKIVEEAENLFDSLYGTEPKDSIFRHPPFLNEDVALAKSNKNNIREVGWGTILTNFLGLVKYTSPKIYTILNDIINNSEWIMTKTTTPLGTRKTTKGNCLISKVNDGYTIDSLVYAFSGTDSINTVIYKIDDTCAVKLNKDKSLNEIIVSGETVNRAALLKAINVACIGYLKPNRKLGDSVTTNEVVNRLYNESKLREQDKTKGIKTITNIKLTDNIVDNLLDLVEQMRSKQPSTILNNIKQNVNAKVVFTDAVLSLLRMKTAYNTALQIMIQERDSKKTPDVLVTKSKEDLRGELEKAIEPTLKVTSANEDLVHVSLLQKSLSVYETFKDASKQLIQDVKTHIQVVVNTLNTKNANGRAAKAKEFDELIDKYTEEFKVQAANTNNVKDLNEEATDDDSATRDEYAKQIDDLLFRHPLAEYIIPTISKEGEDGDRTLQYLHKKASPLVVSMYESAITLVEQAVMDEHFDIRNKNGYNEKTFLPNHLLRILDGTDFDTNIAAKLDPVQKKKIDAIIKKASTFSIKNRLYSHDIQNAVASVRGCNLEEAQKYINDHGSTLEGMDTDIAAAVILKLIEGDPSLILLYNFSVDDKTGKLQISINNQIAYAIYTEALSGFVNYSSLTKRPTDKSCADTLGIDENVFALDPNKESYKKLLNKIGTPEYNASVTLGRNIAQRLNMKIRAKGKTNVALGNRVETTFGKLALAMMQEINNTQISSVTQSIVKGRDNAETIRSMMIELCNAYQENIKLTPPDDQAYGKSGNLIARAEGKASIFSDLEFCFSSEQLHTKEYIKKVNNDTVKVQPKFNSILLQDLAWFVFDHLDYFLQKDPKNSVLLSFKDLKENKGVKNLVKTSRITTETMDVLAANNLNIKATTFIRAQGLSKDSDVYTRGKTSYDTLSNFFVNTDEELRGISHEPITKVADTVTNFAKTPIGATQKTALSNLQKTPHHFDEEAMEIFKKYQTSLFYVEGGKDEDINKDLTEKERQSDKNVSLGRSFAILNTLYDSTINAEGHPDETLNTFYLKYAVMKNMRFNCKSILNPQMDKTARWLTYAGKKRTFNIKNSKEVEFEKWALANAFDMVSKDDKVDKCFDILMSIINNNQLDEFAQDACSLSASDFEDKWGLGMEDRFQVISAIAHLKRRAKAMREGNDTFETTLRVEIDSTTSGYFLRFMTYLDANIINKFGSKVGLVTSINKQLGQIAYSTDITDYNSMESYKKAINDIYREIAVEMSKDDRAALKATWKNIEEFGRNVYGETKEEDYTVPIFKDENEFLAFIDAMPSATLDKNGAWDVSSDLRALLKKVVMVFGYSAGEATMEHNLSEAYTEEYGTQANNAIREFRARNKDKITLTGKDYEDYFQSIANNPDKKMMLQYIKITSKFLGWFIEGVKTKNSYVMNNGHRVPFKVTKAIADTLNQCPKSVDRNTDLAAFIMYERFFKIQNQGYTDPDTKDHYDILPDDLIYNTDRIRKSKKNAKGKKPTEDIKNARSVSYGVKQVFDRTAGEACIGAMKSFAHLSQDNMVLSTIGTMLNADAKKHFTAAMNEGLKKYYKVEEDDWVKRSEVIANDLTFDDYQTFLREYQENHPELDGIFSVIDTAFSLIDGDDYRLQVSDGEWQNVRPTSVNEQIMNHAFSIVAAGVDSNTSGLTNQKKYWFPDPQTTTEGYVTRERQLIDIGLIPTASTVQALDAAVMALFVNLCANTDVDITSVHDAGVVSFLDTDKASNFYNLLAYLVCSKMCIKKQYVMQALIQIKNNPALSKHLSAILNNETSPDAHYSLRRTGMLTDLSYKNLNRLFGIIPADEYYSNGGEGSYYGSDEEGDGYVDTIATVDNYIKLLLNEVYEIDHNWDLFYKQADLYIRNMGGKATGITTKDLKTFLARIENKEVTYREPTEITKPNGKVTTVYSDNYNLTGINKLANFNAKAKLDKQFNALIDSMLKKPTENTNAEVLGSLDTDTLNVTSSWTEVLSAADSCSSAAIIDVLDRLPSSVQDDPRAVANFKSFLSQLDLRNMTGFRVEVAETKDITQGLTTPSQGLIQIAINKSSTSPTNPSPATVYMHEVMHAILNYAFEERKNNPQINRLIEKMRALQEMAAKVITPADLRGNARVNSNAGKQAQEIWNYVFNNKSDNDRGLKEFLSYAVTDRVFIEKLSQVKVPDTKVSIYTRIKQFLTTLWNLITLKTTVAEEVSKRGMFNNTSLSKYAGQDVYNAMLNLVKDIQDANAKATTNIPVYERALYNFYKTVNTFRTLGNKYLVGFTRNLFTFAKLNNVNTLHPTTVDVVKTFASLPFSSEARKIWYDIVSRTCTYYKATDIRLLFDDFATIDERREQLDGYARANRAVEAYYQQIRGIVLDALQTSFGRDLTQDEHKALTKFVLRTDLECLYDGKNYATIKKILTDASKRTKILNSMKTEAFDIKSKNYNIDLSYESQQILLKGIDELSTKWAYVLYYGKGDPLIGTGDDINSVGEKLENAIMAKIKQLNPKIPNSVKNTREWTAAVMNAVKDRLNKMATIKAIEITAQKEPNTQQLIDGLSDKGIQTLLEEHQGFKQNVRKTDSAIERLKEKGKGYLASQYNQAVSYKIVPLTEKDKMEYNGYTLVENLHDKKNLLLESGTGLVMKNNVPMGIFVKKDISVEKRMNSAFSFIASKWSAKDIYSYLTDGITLDQATSDEIVKLVDAQISSGKIEEDQRDAMIARKSKSDIEKRYFKVIGQYRNREFFRIFLSKNLKSNQQIEQEILDSAFDGDSYNPLTIQEKVEKLKQSENAFDLISKQVATQTAFNRGKYQNKALITLLQNFAKFNMNPITNRDIHNHKKYVNITDRLVKELHLSKDLFFENSPYIEGMPLPDVWVREDFIERLFGVKSVSLSQATIKRGERAGYSKYPPFVRKSFEILERILKVLGYKEKETIVVRKPGVLIGNVMSNFSYNCLSEPNWWKVASMQKANIENTNNYLQAQKRVYEIEHKIRIKTATDTERAERNRLLDRMQNNPIAPLFESNMFTNIVEDITLKDKEAVQDYFNKFADSKFVNKLPRALKVMFNQAYMRQGTPIFDAFYNINKYSDFIARATEYQIQMEKHKDEIAKNPARKSIIQKEVLHDVWNAFIDYDRPNGTVEQYLNDMGLMMFTKYAKGIQRVIYKQLTTNPAGLLIHLAREAVVPFDIEDIYEANVFNKDWGLMFHNPFNSLVDVIVPPLPRLILGLL